MHRRIVLALLTLTACSGGGGGEPASPAPASPPGASAPPGTGDTPEPAPGTPAPTTPATEDCAGFVVKGDPRAETGATWTYDGVVGGVTYAIRGILRVPQGTGPFPAVVVSHGKGGTPSGYSSRVAKEMVAFGLVAIGTQYSHAPTDDGLPKGLEGANPENILRAHRTRSLLRCLDYVDQQRVAAHGHSMGAFVTAALVGTHPSEFRAASHTAGGSAEGGVFSTNPATASLIKAPYQMHHGTSDTVVSIEQDRNLARLLDAAGTPNQLIEYPGKDHDDVALDPQVFATIRAWYTKHGVL